MSARRTMTSRLITFTAAVFAVCLCLGVAVSASTEQLNAAAAKNWAVGLFDGAVQSSLIPGASVAIVNGDEPVLLHGFGYADAVAKTPLDPHKTLVNIASVSKTMTGTAIMHALQEGKIRSLDDDIRMLVSNDITITVKTTDGLDTPSGPITLRHLLTHSAGLEDMLTGLFTTDTDLPDQQEALDPFPSRVRRAGEAFAYSNHGIALAAFATAKHLGNESFSSYVQRTVFEPLGMSSTTMMPQNQNDPVSRKVASGALNLARGHSKTASGAWNLETPIFVRAVAAGNVVTTAADMAKYMSFHLGKPAPEVLSADNLEEMKKSHFKNHPQIRGASGISWMLFDVSDKTIMVSHTGDFLYAKTYCGIFPGKKAGLFFSIPRSEDRSNGEVGNFMNKVIESFIARFIDDSFLKPAAAPVPLQNVDLSDYTGIYAPTRRAYMNVEAIAIPIPTLSQFELKVSASGDRLEFSDLTGFAISSLGWNTPVELVPVDEGKDVFRIVPKAPATELDAVTAARFLRRDPRIAFGRDSAGKVKYFFAEQNGMQFTTYDKAGLYSTVPYLKYVILPSYALHLIQALLALPGIIAWWRGTDKKKAADEAAAKKKKDEEVKKEDEAVGAKEDEAKGSAVKRKTAGKKDEAPAPATAAANNNNMSPRARALAAALEAGVNDGVEPDSDPYANEWVPPIVSAVAVSNALFLLAFAFHLSRGLLYPIAQIGSNRLPFTSRLIFALPMATQFLTIPLLTQMIMGTLGWIQRRKTITLPASTILRRVGWYLLITVSGVLIMLETAYFRMSFFDM